ncbi:MAG: hypothetical protein IJD92_03085 [Bacilli bacterium]|nr:hypothetical protein [Bacilli bacterium]
MKNDIKFINDKVVKKILTSEEEENREYLVRIISGVTGIDKTLLKDNIKLVTNEISSNINTVNSVVDAVFDDNREYINIEINYNYSKTTIVKNNIYVYHMILRQVKKSKDYKKVTPVIQININGYDLFGKNDFLYKTQMKEMKYNLIRDEMITVYDINLDFLRNIDYNKIKKGHISDLEKILYLFICDDKVLLDDMYKGDITMDKIRDDFDKITWERDSVLYYDPEDLNRQIIEEKVEEEVNKRMEEINKRLDKETKQTQKLIVKNMIEKGLDDKIIKDVLNIDDETLKSCKEIN